MKRYTILPFYLFILLLFFVSCDEKVSDARLETVLPQIYPDYLGVTIPVNIAPLNFSMVDETVLRIDAVVSDRHGHMLHSQGEESVDFDLDDWHTLLGQNRGDSLSITVSAKFDDGWHTYRSFSIYVSPDSIDYGLCYRLIEPGYEVWSKMGIYERDLSSFDERALIENTQFEGCVNCHSFNRGNSADMSLHIRGPHGATLLRHNGGALSASASIPTGIRPDAILLIQLMLRVSCSIVLTATVSRSSIPPPTFKSMMSRKMSCCFRLFLSKTLYMKPIPFSPLTDVRFIFVLLVRSLRAITSSTRFTIISAVSISTLKRVIWAVV